MEALRQIITSNSNFLTIPIPKEFQKTELEVIIIPIENNNTKIKNKKLLAEAHKIIDLGGELGNIDHFIKEFEKSKSDRKLPNRN